MYRVKIYKTDTPTFIGFINDTHYGKITDMYDTSKVHLALKTYLSKVKKIMASQDIDDLVLVFLGDMVDGQTIYPTQTYATNPSDPLDQAFGLQQTIHDVIEEVGFDSRALKGFVPILGNHGRTTKYLPVETSWDRVFYERLAITGDVGGNILDTAHEQHVVFQVWYKGNPTTMFLHHGHDVRTRGTIPYNGIRNKVVKWLNVLPMTIDYVVMGHWHIMARIPLGDTTILLNGTSVVGDDYVFAMGEKETNRWYGMIFQDRQPTILDIPLYYTA